MGNRDPTGRNTLFPPGNMESHITHIEIQAVVLITTFSRHSLVISSDTSEQSSLISTLGGNWNRHQRNLNRGIPKKAVRKREGL